MVFLKLSEYSRIFKSGGRELTSVRSHGYLRNILMFSRPYDGENLEVLLALEHILAESVRYFSALWSSDCASSGESEWFVLLLSVHKNFVDSEAGVALMIMDGGC